MNKITISVVMPIYNVAPYLKQCLTSLQNQTYPKELTEIILVDDGSTDDSAAICQDFVQQNPHFTYLKQANAGQSAARNYGLTQAKGQYVLFLDSDDWFEPDLLKHLVSASAAGTKKLVEASFTWEFSDHQSFYQAPRCSDLAHFVVHAHVVPWNKLIDRQWLLKTKILFPEGRLYEDQDFFFKLMGNLKDISEVGISQASDIHYRQRGGSTIYTYSEKLTDIFWIYQDILQYYQKNDRFQKELEYRFTRNLLGNILLRQVRHFPQKAQKEYLLKLIFTFIQQNCPAWKHNPYLKERSAVNWYLKLTPNWLFKFIALH